MVFLVERCLTQHGILEPALGADLLTSLRAEAYDRPLVSNKRLNSTIESAMGELRLIDNGRSSQTQERILDVAEALFMEHGFEATGLRQITADADVNLAAV